MRKWLKTSLHATLTIMVTYFIVVQIKLFDLDFLYCLSLFSTYISISTNIIDWVTVISRAVLLRISEFRFGMQNAEFRIRNSEEKYGNEKCVNLDMILII